MAARFVRDEMPEYGRTFAPAIKHKHTALALCGLFSNICFSDLFFSHYGVLPNFTIVSTFV